jgi:hypothetical protein
MPHLAAWLVAILLIVVLVWVTLRWFATKPGGTKANTRTPWRLYRGPHPKQETGADSHGRVQCGSNLIY